MTHCRRVLDRFGYATRAGLRLHSVSLALAALSLARGEYADRTGGVNEILSPVSSLTLEPLSAMTFETLKVEADKATRHLPAKAVCVRYGIVERTLARWLADESLAFPKPMIVHGRRYFDEAEIEAFERAQAGKAAARAKTPEAA